MAIVGIGLEAIGLVVSYLGTLLWFGPTFNGLVQKTQVETVALASSAAITGVGLFFVFFHIARVRPATRSWTLSAALVVLATGIAGAVLQVAFFVAYSAFLSNPTAENAAQTFVTVAGIRGAVALAGWTAAILGLFGLAKHTISP
jgi:NhaP-type Na+/H+ or K+/H+ antiporter